VPGLMSRTEHTRICPTLVAQLAAEKSTVVELRTCAIFALVAFWKGAKLNMNEQIQKLAERAMVSVSCRVCPHSFAEIEDPAGPFVREEFSKAKFAELIVKECLLCLELNDAD
jgi:hypothetical protein